MEIGHIVILCFGLVFVLIGFFMMLAFQKGNRTGQEVQATVVSTRKEGISRSARHFATLRYEMGGQTYTTEISADTINLPDEGSALTIGIEPERPDKVHLRRGKGYIALYVIGGAVVILAIVMAVL